MARWKVTAPRWSFWKIWTGARDVACFLLGARWGEILFSSPPPHDFQLVALVAYLLGMPFIARADELRQQSRGRHATSVNGEVPAGDSVAR